MFFDPDLTFEHLMQNCYSGLGCSCQNQWRKTYCESNSTTQAYRFLASTQAFIKTLTEGNKYCGQALDVHQSFASQAINIVSFISEQQKEFFREYEKVIDKLVQK